MGRIPTLDRPGRHRSSSAPEGHPERPVIEEYVMKVRGQDVLLPATLVGAYPRPIYMEGKVFPVGVHEPEYVSYRMRELYHHAVSAAVRDMLGVGLDIVTDGGQYYENETGYEYAELFHAM